MCHKNYNYPLPPSLSACKKRFHEIKISFPIRGHSFIECDKYLVQQKSRVDLPNEWATHFFTLYKRECPMKIRTIRKLKVVNDHSSACPQSLYMKSNVGIG